MKWQDKELTELTDAELIDANAQLALMHQNYVDKTSDPRFLKKFQNQPLPTVNPAFTTLRDEVTAELNRREITP